MFRCCSLWFTHLCAGVFPACCHLYRQHDSVSSFHAETVLSDGSLLVAGYEEVASLDAFPLAEVSDVLEFNKDFVAFKLDIFNGSVLQKWEVSMHLWTHSKGGGSFRHRH